MIINKGQIVNGGVYNEKVDNYGTIKGGEFNADVFSSEGSIENGKFNAQVINRYSLIKGGEFNADVNNQKGNIENGKFHGIVINNEVSTIKGGEFYNEVANYSSIENAILKNGANLKNFYSQAVINKLIIDGNVKLNSNALKSASSIEMMPNSTLELDSMPDFRKIHNMQNIKVNGNDIVFKDGIFENHYAINDGFFNIPVINQKDGVINGGRFENLENHGTINGGELSFNNNSVETFKNDGIINGGMLLAKNTYNSGIIKNGSFSGTVHNENGTISGGKLDSLELLSGQIQNALIKKELIIKGGSILNVTLRGGYDRLPINGFPAIKNEAGVTIEKLSISGKVKLDASELNNVKSVELLPQKAYGGTILYLDAVPNFSKIVGSGTIKVGNLSYSTDGSIISGQNNATPFVNNSFKLDLAVKKAAEQKSSYIDEKNAQNAQNQQVDLLATPQNSDDNLL